MSIYQTQYFPEVSRWHVNTSSPRRACVSVHTSIEARGRVVDLNPAINSLLHHRVSRLLPGWCEMFFPIDREMKDDELKPRIAALGEVAFVAANRFLLEPDAAGELALPSSGQFQRMTLSLGTEPMGYGVLPMAATVEPVVAETWVRPDLRDQAAFAATSSMRALSRIIGYGVDRDGFGESREHILGSIGATISSDHRTALIVNDIASSSLETFDDGDDDLHEEDDRRIELVGNDVYDHQQQLVLIAGLIALTEGK